MFMNIFMFEFFFQKKTNSSNQLFEKFTIMFHTFSIFSIFQLFSAISWKKSDRLFYYTQIFKLFFF